VAHIAQSRYFAAKDGSFGKVQIPEKFKSLQEAIAFFKANFKEVPAHYKSEPKSVRVMDDDEPSAPAEETSYNGGPTAGSEIWSVDEARAYVQDQFLYAGGFQGDYLCPENLGDEQNYWGNANYMSAEKWGYEIEANYAARGIICVLHFQIVVAPSKMNYNQTKLIYKTGTGERLTITGGALGQITQNEITVSIAPNGTGHLEAYGTEVRTQILTSTNSFIYKAGGSGNYPIGMQLGNGVTIKSSYNSNTAYNIKYGVQFFEDWVEHNHYNVTQQNPCNWGGQPLMGYWDNGTTFVGVPQN